MTSGQPLRIRPALRVHSKSIKKRKRILDAAAEALAEHGYSEAKLADIAQRAGTHAGSLYYYFRSREDLMKEVLLASLDRMTEFSRSLDNESAHQSPLDRVLAFVRLGIDQNAAPYDHYLRAYFRNGNQVPENMRKVLKTRRYRMRRTLARLLREAQTAGEIPAHIDTGVTAQFIIGATNWVGTWYEPTGRCSVERINETFVELVLHGLLGSRGTETPVREPSRPEAIARKRRRSARANSRIRKPQPAG